jgi:hypothetical protein
MGLFSRKSSKPSISDSNVSTHSSDSAGLKSPSVTKASRMEPFSPTSTVPEHKPQIPMPRAPDPRIDPAAYLRSIGAVRERCNIVLEQARGNRLAHFSVDMGKWQDTVKFVCSIIKRDFAPDYSSIPPHGRWQHFNVGGKDRISHLLQSWPSSIDPSERTRRLLDLFLVSVLLDAGAGPAWSYKSKENGRLYRRSEGLAVASLEMFKAGLFSSDPEQPFRVDAEGLKKITIEGMGRALQVSETNPISGLEGRAKLLIRLGSALRNQEFFGVEGRPGNMLGMNPPSHHYPYFPGTGR